MKRLLGPVALGCLFIVGCQRDANPRAEAESHWLDQCVADAECGAGNMCVCGVCTTACGPEEICGGDARPACANVRQLAAVCGEPVAACVRQCAIAADCGAGDFECRAGICAAVDAPPGQPEPMPEPGEPEPQPEPGEPEPQPEPGEPEPQPEPGEPEPQPEPGEPEPQPDVAEPEPGEPEPMPEPGEPEPQPEPGEPEPQPEPGEPEPQPEPGEPEPDPEPGLCPEADAMLQPGVVTPYDTRGADPVEAACGAPGEQVGLRYAFVLDGPATVSVRTQEVDYDSVIELRPACDLERRICNDDGGVEVASAIVDQPLEAGVHHVIVTGFRDAAGQGEVVLEVVPAEPQPDPEPDGPDPEAEVPEMCPRPGAVLQAGQPQPYDTAGAPIAPDGCREDASQVAWFEFVLDAEADVAIETHGERVDPYLILAPGCDFAAVACNDDGAQGLHARIEARLPAGRHVVGVGDFRGVPAQGTVSLTINGVAACANGLDDDGDGLIDFPADPDCESADDLDERRPPACSDDLDNDEDGLVDEDDPGCDGPADDDELAACQNGLDDDEDGQIDFPADPDCVDANDLEAHQCLPEAAPEVPADGRIEGRLDGGLPSRFAATCGGADMPDAVWRYTVAPGTERLTVSADNPGTEHPVTVSLRRRCAVDLSELACSTDNDAPLVIDAPAPGDYYIIVDGIAGRDAWATGEGDLELEDPEGYVPGDDIGPRGWQDAGRDAFDTFGRTQITVGGQRAEIDVSLGQRDVQIGAMRVRVVSERVNNTWRLQLLPLVNRALVDVEFWGNLGSDANTVAVEGVALIDDVEVPYLRTADSVVAPGDPPVVTMMVPNDPDEVDALAYAVNRDTVTATATGVSLPLTLYVTPSYAPVAEVVGAVVDDVAAGVGAERQPLGAFEITVRAE